MSAAAEPNRFRELTVPSYHAAIHTIAGVLKELYPQNPDVVLGREARVIAEHLDRQGVLETEERDGAVMHLISELRGHVAELEAERDRYKAKVAELTQKLAAGAMAVHSDGDQTA